MLYFGLIIVGFITVIFIVGMIGRLIAEVLGDVISIFVTGFKVMIFIGSVTLITTFVLNIM